MRNVPNLYYLQLSENKIAKLKPGALNNLPKLESLGLANNNIAELERVR